MADADPTAPNPSCASEVYVASSAVRDRIQSLVCDLAAASGVAGGLHKLLSGWANDQEESSIWAILRLAEALADDVARIHVDLDLLWLDANRPHRGAIMPKA